MKTPAVLSFVFCVCVLTLSGCGPERPDYGSLNLSEVSGTVTLDGRPLPGATIHFESEDKTFSHGITDANGRYELMFNSEQAGVLKGLKTVRIWSSSKAAGEAETGGEEEGDPDFARRRVEKVPAKYNTKSTLTATVEKDSEVLDFELNSR